MRDALEELRSRICRPGPRPVPDPAALRKLKSRCLVVLPAGGEGSRLRSLLGSEATNKVALKLGGDESLIRRTVRMYRDAGLTRFLTLIYHAGSSVVDDLKDGSDLGVEIAHSEDPGRPVGRGGAILNAIRSGRVPPDATLIVHNPDDQIVQYPGCFPDDVLAGHAAARAAGAVATAVAVGETPYAYTGMEIEEGRVRAIATYPPIPIPTHIGVSVLAPDTFRYFEEMFDLSRKMDFEAVLFPRLVEEGLLHAVLIPPQCWVAVNDPKGAKRFLEAIASWPSA
jgi:NDP-sugar pyrophosphorylase family protein